MRRIVVCERPLSLAIERVDQRSASGGVVLSVRSMTCATWSSPTVGGRPDRGASDNPSRRSFTKPAAPFADRPLIDTQFRRNHLVLNTLGAAQDDAAALGQGTRHLPSAGLTFQEGPFRLAQDQGGHRPSASARHPNHLRGRHQTTIP